MTGVPAWRWRRAARAPTNLLTGIGSCYFDSSPAVFITGQVNRAEQKGDRPIRQLGFQETDIVVDGGADHQGGVARATTPRAARRSSPRRSRWRVAAGPGPVLIDIPMDVQRAEIDAEPLAPPAPAEPGRPTPSAVRRAARSCSLAPSGR